MPTTEASPVTQRPKAPHELLGEVRLPKRLAGWWPGSMPVLQAYLVAAGWRPASRASAKSLHRDNVRCEVCSWQAKGRWGQAGYKHLAKSCWDRGTPLMRTRSRTSTKCGELWGMHVGVFIRWSGACGKRHAREEPGGEAALA